MITALSNFITEVCLGWHFAIITGLGWVPIILVHSLRTMHNMVIQVK